MGCVWSLWAWVWRGVWQGERGRARHTFDGGRCGGSFGSGWWAVGGCMRVGGTPTTCGVVWWCAGGAALSIQRVEIHVAVTTSGAQTWGRYTTPEFEPSGRRGRFDRYASRHTQRELMPCAIRRARRSRVASRDR